MKQKHLDKEKKTNFFETLQLINHDEKFYDKTAYYNILMGNTSEPKISEINYLSNLFEQSETQNIDVHEKKRFLENNQFYINIMKDGNSFFRIAGFYFLKSFLKKIKYYFNSITQIQTKLQIEIQDSKSKLNRAESTFSNENSKRMESEWKFPKQILAVKNIEKEVKLDDIEEIKKKISKLKLTKLIKKMYKGKLRLEQCKYIKSRQSVSSEIFKSLSQNFPKIKETETLNSKIAYLATNTLQNNLKYKSHSSKSFMTIQLIKDDYFLRNFLVKKLTDLIFNVLAIKKTDLNLLGKNKMSLDKKEQYLDEEKILKIKNFSVNKCLMSLINENNIFDTALIVLMKTLFIKSFKKLSKTRQYENIFHHQDEVIRNLKTFGEEPINDNILQILCEKLKININLSFFNDGFINELQFSPKLNENKKIKLLKLFKMNTNYFIVTESNSKEKCDKCLNLFSRNNTMKSRDCIHNYCYKCIKALINGVEVDESIKCYKCCFYNKLHHLNHNFEPIFEEYNHVKKFLKHLNKI